MTGFDLSTSYVEDLEALIRRTRAKLKKVSALKSEDNHIRRSLTPKFEAMANRTLREFSAPTTANIRTGPCWHFLTQSPSEEVLSPSLAMALEMPGGIS